MARAVSQGTYDDFWWSGDFTVVPLDRVAGKVPLSNPLSFLPISSHVEPLVVFHIFLLDGEKAGVSGKDLRPLFYF